MYEIQFFLSYIHLHPNNYLWGEDIIINFDFKLWNQKDYSTSLCIRGFKNRIDLIYIIPEGLHRRWKISSSFDGHVHFEELIQVTVLTVFHYYAQRLFNGAYTQHSSYILVFETSQNSYIVLQFGSVTSTQFNENKFTPNQVKRSGRTSNIPFFFR
jgi:hypothetical protein